MRTFARIWFGLTAASSLIGMAIGLALIAPSSKTAAIATMGGAGANPEDFMALWQRVVAYFSYFTVQSNVIIVVTSLLLATRLDRSSLAFQVWRLTGLSAITVTGLVYNLLLAPMATSAPTGWNAVQQDLLHVVTPLMALVGWLVFGPRAEFRWLTVLLTGVWGTTWLAYTMVRGALIDWYPYPFLNAWQIGYARTALNCAFIAVLFLGLAAGILGLDRVLPQRGPSPGALRNSPSD